MNRGFDLSIISIIMPILISIIFFVIAVMLIIVFYKTKKAQSLNFKSFEALAKELRSDNEMLKLELVAMKATLDSIHKMLKEIE